MSHLLVTNDFPPKVGGIQAYLWELWRRLPPGTATVLTPSFEGDAAFDADQPFGVVRVPDRVLLPTPGTVRRIDRLAAELDVDGVLLDPAMPVGLVGPRLERRYGLVLHGAEITVPGRLPGSRRLLRSTLRSAGIVVSAGGYPAEEASRAAGTDLPIVVVPPGVDAERFSPLDDAARLAARRRFGLPEDGRVVVSVSRLVPRKGMDVLVRAAAELARQRDDLVVAIAGDGRDRGRLEHLAAREGAPVRFLGRVDDAHLPEVYGLADVFAMLCRSRWLGLEQEGFGIVFLEAAAAGVPQVAGRSGGSAEAVVDGETGLVVDDPTDVGAVIDALTELLDDEDRRAAMAAESRRRAVDDSSYDALAARLATALAGWEAADR